MLWAASIDGHLSSLVACHCTYLYLFNLFVYLANKLSLSLSLILTVLTASVGFHWWIWCWLFTQIVLRLEGCKINLLLLLIVCCSHNTAVVLCVMLLWMFSVNRGHRSIQKSAARSSTADWADGKRNFTSKAVWVEYCWCWLLVEENWVWTCTASETGCWNSSYYYDDE